MALSLELENVTQTAVQQLKKCDICCSAAGSEVQKETEVEIAFLETRLSVR